VQQPVLLMRSRHDKVVPPVSAEAFLGAVGSDDVTVRWLEDSAHVAPLDHDAEDLISFTLDFVDRMASDGG